jgi:putative ABC transport system permease protein
MVGTMPLVLSDLLFDIRYAARNVLRQPGFAAAVALTLALGLGLNAAVFGMMDALLLRPFQFAEYDRLVVLFETPKDGSARDPVAPATYLDWRRQLSSVDPVVGFEGWGATLGDGDAPERLQGFRVSPGFFETLGIVPQVGRTFAPEEAEPASSHRVIISDGLWQRRFGGDLHVIGSDVILDGVPYAIVGVAPSGFEFPFGADVWAPLAFSPDAAADRRSQSLTVMGKLAPGRTLDDARAEIAVIAQALAERSPETHRDRETTVRSLSTAFREDTAGSLVAVLQAAAGMVLLVACINLAGLLLARANDRQREVAVRAALGASRARIVRQLVVEMVLLALVASVIALVAARMGLEVLRTSVPADVARHIEGWNNVRLDHRLVVVVPALAVIVGLVVGLWPALRVSGGNLADPLKDSARGTTGGVRPQRARQALVVAEIAFALTLLVATGLTLAGGARMVEAPGGFESRRLLTFGVPLPETRYGDPSHVREFARRLAEQLESTPGIEHAALANVLPASGWSPSRPLLTEGPPLIEGARRPTPGFRAVSAGYFETLRVPVLRGRSFTAADREDAEPVAIVSTSLAARLWPGQDPLGRRVQLADAEDPWRTIVGIVGDVTMYNWWDGIDRTAIYVPLTQSPPLGGLGVAVRTHGAPAAAAGASRTALASIDPLLAVDNLRTMEQAIAGSTFGLNMMGRLLGICGGLSLLLAVVGIYSMMAYAVSQRRHEFGVRMALGASAADVLRLSLRQAGAMTVAGLGIGVLLAAALGRLMSAALVGVIEFDPAIVVALTSALGVVALMAALVPALRSAHVDPVVVLRGE